MERLEMDMLMIRIHALMGSGRYTEARRMLEEALEREPANGSAHGMMGWICWALLDEHDRALVHFRCAVRWAPALANTWMHYLNVLAGDGHTEELREAYGRALQVPGIDRAEVHAIVARFLERRGELHQALGRYREAARCAMNSAVEHALRSDARRVRARIRRSRWERWFAAG